MHCNEHGLKFMEFSKEEWEVLRRHFEDIFGYDLE